MASRLKSKKCSSEKNVILAIKIMVPPPPS